MKLMFSLNLKFVSYFIKKIALKKVSNLINYALYLYKYISLAKSVFQLYKSIYDKKCLLGLKPL